MEQQAKADCCPFGKCPHSCIVHREIKNERGMIVDYGECAVCTSKRMHQEPGDWPCTEDAR